MGIRIHKKLGWALTDVAYEDYEIVDPRINPDSFLFNSKWSKSAKTIQDFMEWLEDNPPNDKFDTYLLKMMVKRDIEDTERIAAILEDHDETKAAHRMRRELEDRYSPQECVTWGAEYLLGNVLLVQPPVEHNWSRRDDTIDWVEEALQREPSAENHFEVLKDAPFPYNALLMDARTGERIIGDVGRMAQEWYRFTYFLDLTYEENEKTFEDLALVSGFDSHEDALENCVPQVPAEVHKLCEWGELFTNDTVWRSLRPTLYVYWS